MESLQTTDAVTNKKSAKLKKLILGLALLGLVSLACLGTVVYVSLDQIRNNIGVAAQAVSILADKPVYNQIAIVANDRNVQLVSPDGQQVSQITGDGKGYRFPTWAPDGRYLAFIGPDEENNTALYVTPTSRNAPTVLFNKPDSAPFYLYWSPDSHLITFLTQEKSGMAMRQVDAEAGTSRVLAKGAPFYWVWSPLSDKLLMHVGGSRAFSDKAHLSILENQEEAERIELDLAPGRFQAPHWSADGHYFFYIATDDQGKEAIYRTDANTLEQKRVTRLTGFTFMVLAPDGQHIAYLQIERTRPPFGTAYIVDTDGKNRRRLTDNPIGSMYWSPDGKKLALLTVARQESGPTAKTGGLAAPLPQEILFRWLIYHVETEELEPLISFNPTPDFIQTVPYFDQYHLSLTFWSPDSRYLVVTKRKPGENKGTVWVVDTTGQEEPRQVGEGTLAVWSWQ